MKLKNNWPVIIATLVLWLVVVILLLISLKQNQGHLVYALDDSYIHMAMAKNVAQNGTWGVTRHSFSSSSSSLLWTLLLSLDYLLCGVNETAPMVINLILATVLIWLIYGILQKYKIIPSLKIVILISIIFFTPLYSLIFCGQEHILHTILTVIFVYLAGKVLGDTSEDFRRGSKYRAIWLLLISPLVIMARYEGIFLIIIVCLLFFLRKKYLYSLLLGGLGALPVVIYGLISISRGWYFIPNSILLKGNMPDFSSLKTAFFFITILGYQLVHNPQILILLLIALVVLYFQCVKKNTIWEERSVMLIVFIATALLHLQFAGTNWFYRYEAYLIGLGVFVVSVSFNSYLRDIFHCKSDNKSFIRYVTLALIVIITILPLVERGLVSLMKTPRAMTNIYEQQYQMGLFLKEFYQNDVVAANDIGAINYLADIKCLDLWGLGNRRIGKTRIEGCYNTRQIYETTKSERAKIAVVYDELFNRGTVGGLPKQWIKAGQWRIFNNEVCAYDVVSFYAFNLKEAEKLKTNLKAFSSRLPKTVKQEIF